LYVGRKYEMRNNEVELAKQNYQKIKKLYIKKYIYVYCVSN